MTLYEWLMTDEAGSSSPPGLAPYLAAMVRRLPPTRAGVVPGSTPVVAFGDPARARVATLGINPSRREFTDEQGRMLTEAHRRLATLASLGASRLDRLDDAQVASVVAECGAYFRRQPYRRWFDPLDALIRAGTGASFYDETACHLDLVQWATDPVWGQMPDQRARRALIEDGCRTCAPSSPRTSGATWCCATADRSSTRSGPPAWPIWPRLALSATAR